MTRALVGVARTTGLLLAVSGCAARDPRTSTPEFFPIPDRRTLPFSEAVRVGDLLFLSGQLGTDSAGRLVPGGIGPETRQALTNIAGVLARHGSDLRRVVKCTVMLADIGEWAAMNEVYVTFFPSHRPARSTFGSTGLALGARLELECIATVPSRVGQALEERGRTTVEGVAALPLRPYPSLLHATHAVGPVAQKVLRPAEADTVPRRIKPTYW